MSPETRLTVPGKKAILLGLILVLTIAGPWLVGGENVTHALSQVAVADIGFLIAIVATRWALIAFRLWILLCASAVHLRARDIMTAVWAYDFAAESTPGGVGGAAVGVMVFRFLAVPLRVIAGVGAITLIFDILAVMSILAVLATTTSLLTDHAMHWKVIFMLILMSGALATAWLLTSFRHPLIRLLGQLPWVRRIPLRMRKAGARAWLHIAKAVTDVLAMAPGKLLLIVATSVGAWVCRLSIIYLAVGAVNAQLPLADAMLIQFVGGLAGVLVMLPGGFIGADLMTSALLHPFLGAGTIASVLILWRIFTFHTNVILGGASLAWYSLRMAVPGSLREP